MTDAPKSPLEQELTTAHVPQPGRYTPVRNGHLMASDTPNIP